jgi:hypothetical protein
MTPPVHELTQIPIGVALSFARGKLRGTTVVVARVSTQISMSSSSATISKRFGVVVTGVKLLARWLKMRLLLIIVLHEVNEKG